MRRARFSGPVIERMPDGIHVLLWQERYWPRWLCWLFGHEPTESADVACAWRRCRCGAYECGDEDLFRKPHVTWWFRLVQRLP